MTNKKNERMNNYPSTRFPEELKIVSLDIPQAFLEFISKINNASVVTRYPEDFQKLLAAYPEEVAKSYFTATNEVIEWLRRNEKLKK